MGRWVARWLLPVLALAATSACSRPPPSGQVLARVNGTDITRRDVLTELTASGAPADVDIDTATPALLDGLVTRRLLVDEATRQSIDRSPEFLGQMRRDRDMLLARLLRERLAEDEAGTAQPAADPAALDRRMLFDVDRLTLLTPVDPAILARLPSIDAAADWLTRHCVPFRRDTVRLDSLALDPDQATRLRGAGERLVVGREKGAVTLDRVLSMRTIPVAAGEQAAIAAALAQQTSLRARLEQLTNRLRRTAHVEYARRQDNGRGHARTPRVSPCSSTAGDLAARRTGA
ncbi:hypothetical protein SAMN05192583_3143 [Sphingomonas gellani]|uniref:Peptidyl-prolyl cis-trans isomerase, EpsD family n=1 Tax=Sphingomonas gellani TaxID=1166340 RepID=A0A1H8HY80_9SPHN|nr:hypothetical protein [Sphingomonas gellani]SEN61032.1 hypothetical protein SAMN05192583_3143 [Sphingomonas gellani]